VETEQELHLRRCVMALRLEVDSSIADSVSKAAEVVIAESKQARAEAKSWRDAADARSALLRKVRRGQLSATEAEAAAASIEGALEAAEWSKAKTARLQRAAKKLRGMALADVSGRK